MLSVDGTLALTATSSGSLDLSGYQVTLDPVEIEHQLARRHVGLLGLEAGLALDEAAGRGALGQPLVGQVRGPADPERQGDGHATEALGLEQRLGLGRGDPDRFGIATSPDWARLAPS